MLPESMGFLHLQHTVSVAFFEAGFQLLQKSSRFRRHGGRRASSSVFAAAAPSLPSKIQELKQRKAQLAAARKAGASSSLNHRCLDDRQSRDLERARHELKKKKQLPAKQPSRSSKPRQTTRLRKHLQKLKSTDLAESVTWHQQSKQKRRQRQNLVPRRLISLKFDI